MAFGFSQGADGLCSLRLGFPIMGSIFKPSFCATNADAGSSLLPAGVLVSHIFSIGYLSFVAGRTICRSYLALPPSSGTRYREPLRRGYVHAFSMLSLVSLASAAFFAVRFSSLSYQVWATERGIELPERFVVLICCCIIERAS
jgi:hypothetical protein